MGLLKGCRLLVVVVQTAASSRVVVDQTAAPRVVEVRFTFEWKGKVTQESLMPARPDSSESGKERLLRVLDHKPVLKRMVLTVAVSDKDPLKRGASFECPPNPPR